MTSELGALTTDNSNDPSEIKKISVQLTSMCFQAGSPAKTKSVNLGSQMITKKAVKMTTSASTTDMDHNKEQVQSQAIGLNDFYFLEELGDGSFSTVYLVSEKKTGRRYAAKVCHKVKILRENKVKEIHREKEIMRLLSTKENAHPFIVQLMCTFQDSESLYFVLTLATRKDLLHLIRKRKEKPLSIDQCKFVAAELLSGMGHIHRLKIVHRDLKPENVLVKEDGHIMISDFGCAKRLEEKSCPVEEKQESTSKKRRCSFVGTPQYVLNGVEVQQACDYWSFGVLLFEILSHRRPFADVSEYFMYKKILRVEYSFGDDFPDCAAAKELITALLVLEPSQRLGAVELGGDELVKDDRFFKDIDWENLPNVVSPIL